MFDGRAEEAMRFYCEIFSNAKMIEMEKFGRGEMGAEGTILRAVISIKGQDIICIDSPVQHEFTFTPAVSLLVDCDNTDEIERLYLNLADGGKVLMPLDSYPFSQRYGWLTDRFGVSWQLNLA